MISALATFVILGGLLFWREKQSARLCLLRIATVAALPIGLVVLAFTVLGSYYPDPLALAFVPLVVLIAATFVLLLRLLSLPVGKSVAYTGVVLAVNVGVAAGL